MKKNIGKALALYPVPLIVVGSMVDGKPNVIYKFQPYYFPHVYSEDYKDGWYDKVEARQGKNNTYYGGEIMSFGDRDETCEYSRDLVSRFFAD